MVGKYVCNCSIDPAGWSEGETVKDGMGALVVEVVVGSVVACSETRLGIAEGIASNV